jgi:hypothetical protein
MYRFLVPPTRTTSPAHITTLDLIIVIIFNECKLRSSSLCSFLHHPITLSLRSDYSLRHFCSQTFLICVYSALR